MSERATICSLIVLLGVVSLVAWWWWAAPGVMPPVTPSPSSATATAPVDRVVSADRGQRVALAGSREATAGATAAAPRLRGSGQVTVHVETVDMRFVPVPDVLVTCRANDRSGDVLEQRRSDARGRCDFEVDAAKGARFDALDSSGRRAVPLWPDLLEPGQVPEAIALRMVLLDYVQVAGVVVDEHSQPVAEARVVALANLMSRPAIGAGAQEVAKTDAAGRFVLSLTPGGEYELQATAGDRETVPRRVRATGGDRARPEVVLRLAGAIVVTGTVYDARGEPAVDATVTLQRGDDVGARTEVFTVHGKFRAELPEFGTYHVAAVGHGFASSESLRVTVSEATPSAEVALRLRPMQTISGRVVDAEGAPIGGVALRLMPVGSTATSLRIKDRHNAVWDEQRSDESGHFRFFCSGQQSYGVAATFEGREGRNGALVAGVVAGTSDLQIVVGRPGARVVGVVTGPDGLAIERLRVDVLPKGAGLLRLGQVANVISADDGRFEVESRVRGQEFFVQVTDASGACAPGFCGPFRDDGQAIEAAIALQPWGELPVRVFDASGAPVPAASVSVLPAGAITWVSYGGPASRRNRTGADGSTELTRCAPGPCKILVSCLDGRRAHAEVTIRSGSNAPLVVRVP